MIGWTCWDPQASAFLRILLYFTASETLKPRKQRKTHRHMMSFRFSADSDPIMWFRLVLVLCLGFRIIVIIMQTHLQSHLFMIREAENSLQKVLSDTGPAQLTPALSENRKISFTRRRRLRAELKWGWRTCLAGSSLARLLPSLHNSLSLYRTREGERFESLLSAGGEDSGLSRCEQLEIGVVFLGCMLVLL